MPPFLVFVGDLIHWLFRFEQENFDHADLCRDDVKRIYVGDGTNVASSSGIFERNPEYVLLVPSEILCCLFEGKTRLFVEFRYEFVLFPRCGDHFCHAPIWSFG